MASEPSCWCGNRSLEPFSKDYLHCPVCETLVVAHMPAAEALLVNDDERDYYGKHYFDEVAQSHGLPPLNVRARADLPERCLHWLRGMLRYCSPPARVLELGSAHGGYVAMLRWAGFDATGLDLSPEIVADARRRFDVPILQGPIETQNIPEASLDAIVMMDVLEHLGNPKETLGACLRLLKPEGLLFIQTPQYREGKSLAQMEQEDDPFLRLLTPDQHLYLFSRSSVVRLFRELGVEHVNFEPAMFSFYDMALVAGRGLPVAKPEEESLAVLEESANGRLTLAMCDLDRQREDLARRLKQAEEDASLRLENNSKLEKLLAEQSGTFSAHLAAQAKSAEELTVQVANRDQQIGDLTARLLESEADRAVRLENIAKLESLLAEAGARLQESEADRAVRLENIAKLESLLAEAGARLRESEADRAVRLENIAKLEKLIAEQTASHAEALAQLAAAHDSQIRDSAAKLRAAEARDKELAAQVRDLSAGLERSKEDSAATAAAFSAITQELRKQLGEMKAIIETQQHSLSEAENVFWNLRRSRVVQTMRRMRGWTWLDWAAPNIKLDEPAPVEPAQVAPVKASKPVGQLRKIVVDLTPVLPGGGNGGAKVMTVELIRQLARLAPACEFILLTSEVSHDELAWLDAANVSRICLTRPGSALSPASGKSIVQQLDADLLFCPFTAAFYFDPTVPMVCVVYDLQHAYYPEFFTNAEIQERGRNLDGVIKGASKIVCISEYVRSTVLEKTGAPPERVETVHILLPRRLGTPTASECEAVLSRLNLVSEDFLLYPANFWPHKNHELLLTAFGMYLAAHPESKVKLVLTGSPGERQDFMKDAVRRMGMARAVTFPGYLLEQELSVLFHSCLALIFPSLFEGFGMPLLEAMAAGRPILCSNTTSLPEVAGDAAILFDPRKPEEIANAVARVTIDADLRKDLATRSARRLSAFGGPQDMAASYLAKFRQAVQARPEAAPGVYDGFEDRWLGEHFTVVAGSGADGRRIHLTLELPEWAPLRSVFIRAEGLGADDCRQTLARGEVTVMACPISPEAGTVHFYCSPSFQPSKAGFGDDTRTLTCRLQQAEIIAGSDTPVTLGHIRYGA